jgi:hypothetical protein
MVQQSYDDGQGALATADRWALLQSGGFYGGGLRVDASLVHQRVDSPRWKAGDQVVQQVFLPRLAEDHPVHG